MDCFPSIRAFVVRVIAPHEFSPALQFTPYKDQQSNATHLRRFRPSREAAWQRQNYDISSRIELTGAVDSLHSENERGKAVNRSIQTKGKPVMLHPDDSTVGERLPRRARCAFLLNLVPCLSPIIVAAALADNPLFAQSSSAKKNATAPPKKADGIKRKQKNVVYTPAPRARDEWGDAGGFATLVFDEKKLELRIRHTQSDHMRIHNFLSGRPS